MTSRRTLFCCWSIFLVACVVLGGLKDWQNRQFRAAEAQFVAEVKESDLRHLRIDPQAFHEVANLLSKADPHGRSRPGWSREALRESLPGNPALETVPSTDPKGATVAEWMHPLSFHTWKFYFDAEDRVSGWQSVGRARPQPVPVSRATFEDRGERLRRVVAHWGQWLWVGVFAGWLFAGRFRPLVGHLLLAVAIACTIVDAISPGYLLWTLFSNDAVYPDALMVAISCAALATVSPALWSLLDRPWLPKRLGIRWIAMNAVAVITLLAFGEDGFVMASVLFVGMVAYGVLAPRFGRAALPQIPDLPAHPNATKPATL